MRPKLFDIHSHLNFHDFDKDREEVIKRMQENGIWTICVGTDKKTSKEVVELAEKHENIFASIGLHPTDSNENFNADFYRELAKHPKMAAIGECGLDYYRIKNKELRIKQKDLFKQHIELALELNKPLMIHCRDAHEDALNILSSYLIIDSPGVCRGQKQNSRLRGNIHFFSGTWEQAQKYFDFGFSISFAGPITFPPLRQGGVNQYDEIIKNAPLDKIMIETDSPFAAPTPFRGRRNEPIYVIEIAKKLAEIKKLSLEKIIKQTAINAENFFNLSI